MNYFSPPNTTQSGVCAFCDGTGECLDTNLSLSDTGEAQIARVVTTYHDAFDGAERGVVPTNGDSFTLEASPSGEACSTAGNLCLRYGTATYGLTTDEEVTLPVSAIPTWFFHWNTEANLLNALREAPMMKGLGKTMRDYGYNWCQACELFAHHGSQPKGTVQNRFLACIQEPISDYLAVDPPNSSGRIRASDCTECPPLTISAPDGTCQPCGPGEQVVGNVCSPCTAGQIVTPAGVCQDCAPQDIVVNNTCVPCDLDEAPDSNRTACVVCPTDLVIDWRNVPDECFEGLTVRQVDYTAPGDRCPERLVIQVTELHDVFGFDPGSGGISFGVTSGAASAAECSANVSSANVGILGPGGLTSLASHQANGSWKIVESECEHPDVVLATRAEIQAGAATRAIIASAVRGNASVPLELMLASIGQPSQCGPF